MAGKIAYYLFVQPVVTLANVAIQVPHHIAMLATDVGVIPALFMGAAAFGINFGFEALEDFVLHSHFFCVPFATFLWGNLAFAAFNITSIRDVVLFKTENQGIWGRFKTVFENPYKEFRRKRLLKHIAAEEVPFIMNQDDFKNYLLHHPSPLASAFAHSALWSDYFVARHLKQKREPREGFPLLPQSEILERMEGFWLLRKLLQAELDLAHSAKKIGYREKLSANYQLGKIHAALSIYHRSLWFAVDETRDREELDAWIHSVEREILTSMKVFFEYLAQTRQLNSIMTQLNLMLDHSKAFRRGKLPELPCQLVVAEAG